METEYMVIKPFDVVKYLGVSIDEKLTGNAHVEYVCASLVKKVTKNAVRQLYHAFLYSQMICSREIWEGLFKNISEHQVIKNKSLKYIIHLDIRTPTDFLHTSHNIIKVEDMHEIMYLILQTYISSGYGQTF